MFRLSVITDEISQDLDAAIDFVRHWGLEGVELRSVWDKGPFEWDAAHVERIRARLQEENLPVCGIGSPLFKCSFYDAAVREQQLEALRRCCDFAHTLGAPKIRGFSFWKEENLSMDALAEAYVPVEAILREQDMALVIEPDPDINTPNASTLAALLERIGSEHIGALWDPGNLLWDSAQEVPYPDGYERIRPWLRHVHLKDGVVENGKARAVAFSTGLVDMEGQLRRLLSDGYTGWVSLEPHYRLDRKLSTTGTNMSFAGSFSDGGREAGDDTMTRLREKMELWGLQ